MTVLLERETQSTARLVQASLLFKKKKKKPTATLDVKFILHGKHIRMLVLIYGTQKKVTLIFKKSKCENCC